MGSDSSREAEAGRSARTVHSEYRMGPPLGKGSFGQVFRVSKRLDPGTIGAVKVSRKANKRGGGQQDYWNATNVFNREVAILKSLEHPTYCNSGIALMMAVICT